MKKAGGGEGCLLFMWWHQVLMSGKGLMHEAEPQCLGTSRRTTKIDQLCAMSGNFIAVYCHQY
jgi:hypothetical protein